MELFVLPCETLNQRGVVSVESGIWENIWNTKQAGTFLIVWQHKGLLSNLKNAV
jgi:hypothetical protein